MIEDANDGVGRDGGCARTDRYMRLGNPNDVEQQRHGEDLSAATNKAEQHADQPA